MPLELYTKDDLKHILLALLKASAAQARANDLLTARAQGYCDGYAAALHAVATAVKTDLPVLLQIDRDLHR